MTIRCTPVRTPKDKVVTSVADRRNMTVEVRRRPRTADARELTP